MKNDMNTWLSRQDHYPAEKRSFNKNPLHTSYDDLDYMDSKHFSKIVWWQLGALILIGLFCASLLVIAGVVLVNFFVQHPTYLVLSVLAIAAVYGCFRMLKFIRGK